MPQTLNHSRSSSFCARCISIDFEKISSWTVPDSFGLHVMNLEATAKELRAADCGLCQLFGSVSPQDLDESSRLCHLRAFSAQSIFGGNDDFRLWDFPDIAILGVASFKIGASTMETKMRHSLLKTGFLSMIEDPRNSERSRFRLIDPITFDADFAKYCISYCQSTHGPQCNSKGFPSMRFFRVINCKTRTIVDGPSDCIYIALSYVWGTSASSTSPQGTNALPALEFLPKVVTDSIETTLKLGFLYLWIDKYCIDQSNEQIKYEQIRQMDLIYSNAEVTIIAAAGQDATFGLPGVNGTLRKFQPHLKIGRHCLATTLSHPRAIVESSKWSTRGWTFQEGILSKRRLIFTDQQIIFDCSAVHCTEVMAQLSKAMHKDAAPYSSTDSSELETPIGPFVHKITGDPTTIMSFIAEFNQRSLSFPEDRLNAIQGIFQSFAKSPWPLWHVMGIPIFHPEDPQDIIKTWRPPCSPELAFAAGLTWKSISPGQRNAHFPSWTWAGWMSELDQEPVSFCPLCRLEATPSLIYYPKIWLEGSDKNLTSFPGNFKDLDLLLQPAKLCKFFYIESIAFGCSLVNNPAKRSSHSMVSGIEFDVPKDGLYIKLLTRTSGNVKLFVRCVPDKLYTSSNKGKMQALELPEDKTLTGVLLSNCHEGYCRSQGKILVLEENGDHSQRVGLALLDEAYAFFNDIEGRSRGWQRLDSAQIRRSIDNFHESRKIRVG